MRVFKFGGASVKDADSVKNVAAILRLFHEGPLVIVVSAMGKTTNALEKVVQTHCNAGGNAFSLLDDVRKYHLDIMDELFSDPSDPVYGLVNNFFVEAEWILEEEPRPYDFVYDQIVSIGELVSTAILSAWLNREGLPNRWLDVRDCLITDDNYREARVDWPLTGERIRNNVARLIGADCRMVVTQGFIGATADNYTTTLGREGSDYTAAVFSHFLDAESVTIWKDVPGVLNADPRYFTDAQKLEQLSYSDAIELSYYGASVIHPKTIKPLENKDIPLYVKSFRDPGSRGTVIGKNLQTKPQVPSFILKNDQMLISLSAKDFSFIAEDNLSEIFGIFAALSVKINLMQNSAITFSVCVDDDPMKTPQLLARLQQDYRLRYNTGVQLYTVRYYYPSTLEMLSDKREILLEQRSRTTAQLVMRSGNIEHLNK